jgi:acyl carrier protein
VYNVEINHSLKQIISNVLQYTGDLNEQTCLESTGMNSINFIQIVVELEMRFNFSFEDEELIQGNYPTFGKFEEFIAKKTGLAINKSQDG